MSARCSHLFENVTVPCECQVFTSFETFFEVVFPDSWRAAGLSSCGRPLRSLAWTLGSVFRLPRGVPRTLAPGSSLAELCRHQGSITIKKVCSTNIFRIRLHHEWHVAALVEHWQARLDNESATCKHSVPCTQPGRAGPEIAIHVEAYIFRQIYYFDCAENTAVYIFISSDEFLRQTGGGGAVRASCTVLS